MIGCRAPSRAANFRVSSSHSRTASASVRWEARCRRNWSRGGRIALTTASTAALSAGRDVASPVAVSAPFCVAGLGASLVFTSAAFSVAGCGTAIGAVSATFSVAGLGASLAVASAAFSVASATARSSRLHARRSRGCPDPLARGFLFGSGINESCNRGQDYLTERLILP